MSEEEGFDKEARVLNPIVRIDKEGVSYDADPRHVEMIVEALDLHGQPINVTPGLKEDDVDLDALLDVDASEDVLDPEGYVDSISLFTETIFNKIKGSRRFTFAKDVYVRFGDTETKDIVPYSETYHKHLD